MCTIRVAVEDKFTLATSNLRLSCPSLFHVIGFKYFQIFETQFIKNNKAYEIA